MYAKILVPIDGSDTALLGLNQAIELAKNQHSKIRLMHVVNETVVVDAMAVNLTVISERLRKSGEALLGQMASLVRDAGVEVDTVLEEALGGQAGPRIVEQATKWRADLIVCGTHGRRGIQRIVMGSDAEYIVRHTPVPVLLVRSREPVAK
jgi:nucleotide-binding universal stress UspA family protein